MELDHDLHHRRRRTLAQHVHDRSERLALQRWHVRRVFDDDVHVSLCELVLHRHLARHWVHSGLIEANEHRRFRVFGHPNPHRRGPVLLQSEPRELVHAPVHAAQNVQAIAQLDHAALLLRLDSAAGLILCALAEQGRVRARAHDVSHSLRQQHGLALRHVGVAVHLKAPARLHHDQAVRAIGLSARLLDVAVRDRARFGDHQVRVDRMQRLGTALVHFVLRVDQITDFAVAVIVAVDVTALGNDAAQALAVIVLIRTRPRCEDAALAELGPHPLAALKIPDLNDPDALALRVSPHLPARAILVRVAKP